MDNGNANIRLSGWIEELQSKGKHSFSVRHVHKLFPSYSDIALKRSLSRLSEKKKVVSIFKGYYLIIPPQYLSKGVLPPPIYIDEFMKFLERPYYVGLLNAASFHGSAHQRPQEYFIFTIFPVLRPTEKKGIKVNFISKKKISEKLLEDRKTESGYLKISSPELTAADLVQFERRVGGLNRVATVLNELAEALKPEGFSESFFDDVASTSIQRLGYLLDKELGFHSIADELFEKCKNNGFNFFRIPLKASQNTKGHYSDEKWKVIVNTKIEIDE